MAGGCRQGQASYLSTLPAADVDVLERVLQGPLVPLPADGAKRRRGIPLEQLGGNGAPHIALELGPLERQWGLLQAKRVGRALADIGLGNLVEDLGEDLVGEVVEVH